MERGGIRTELAPLLTTPFHFTPQLWETMLLVSHRLPRLQPPFKPLLLQCITSLSGLGLKTTPPHLHAPPLDPPTVSITYWDYLIHTLDNCHLPFKEINVMATPPSLHVFPLFRWILKSTIVLSLRGQWLDFQSLVSIRLHLLNAGISGLQTCTHRVLLVCLVLLLWQ